MLWLLQYYSKILQKARIFFKWKSFFSIVGTSVSNVPNPSGQVGVGRGSTSFGTRQKEIQSRSTSWQGSQFAPGSFAQLQIGRSSQSLHCRRPRLHRSRYSQSNFSLLQRYTVGIQIPDIQLPETFEYWTFGGPVLKCLKPPFFSPPPSSGIAPCGGTIGTVLWRFY